jgi:large subunit ribosomal protein L3
MPGLLGKKIGMTSIFDDEGNLIPCTVIEAGPCVVLQVKAKDPDGYDAVQLGYGEKKASNTSKAEMGHYEKHSATEPPRFVREFRLNKEAEFKSGDVLTVERFEVGDYVTLSGISKGKGFQGVMKRHGFSGVGGTTHGQSNRLRAPGSIGQSSYPSRVFKGMRMGGRTGGNRTTYKNVTIIKILPESNLILVKGPVPGTKKTFLEIHKQA